MLNLEGDKRYGKVFCIGFNKTGTTSLNRFMEVHGYNCGNQAEGELLMEDYAKSKFDRIINFCQSADFFQDLPFGAPLTVNSLVNAYPNAGYILTVRTSPEVWYNSLITFHSLVFGGGKVPTANDLKRGSYRFPGFAWLVNRTLYSSPEGEPYKRECLLDDYRKHLAHCQSLFEGKSNFLILDLTTEDAVEKLSAFLGIKPLLKNMPWLNKTSDRK